MTMLDPDLRTAMRRRNLAHTWLLAAGSVALLLACAFLIAGPIGVVWAGFGGVFSLVVAWNVSPKMVLRLYAARPLPAHAFPEGHRIVAELAARAGLARPPTLWYVPSRMMNAFAVGRNEEAVICVTDGLIRGLTLREFTAVIAHELAHVAADDLKVMALADVTNRMTGILSMLGLVFLFLNLPAILAGDLGQVPVFGILLLLVAPTLGGLMQLALSRTREYDADLSAVQLTGDPEGLAAALLKLERIQGRLWEALALPHGRIPNPSLLRTHPDTNERVRRILALAGSTRHTRFDGDDRPPTVGRSIIPVTGAPRYRARGLGHWY
ncbi:M48 family metalloprotease [Amorphus sp. 3PC139-8]